MVHIVKLRIYRLGWVILVATVLSSAGAIVAYKFNVLDAASQEIGAYDNGLTFWTQTKTQSNQVVIVALDDETLREIEKDPVLKRNYGTWPYARSLWALLFQYLGQTAGAKAVVLDALLTDHKPDDQGMIEVLENAKVPIYVGFSIEQDGWGLPEVVAQNRFFPQVLSLHAQTPEQGKTLFLPESQHVPSDVTSKKAAQALAFPVTTHDLSLSLFPKVEFKASADQMTQTKQLFPQPPIETLWDLLPGFGLVLIEAMDGGDGKIRQTRFAYTDGKNTYVTLSVAVVADLFHADHLDIRPHRLTLGSHQYEINADGSAGIDFGGPFAERFKIVSLIDVIRAAKNSGSRSKNPNEKATASDLDALFHDKIVMIGGFAAGTSDLKATPFDPFVPGVVKHASEIDNFLSGHFLVKAHFGWSVLLTVMVSLLSVLIILIVQSDRLEVAWPIALFFLLYLGPGFLLVHDRVHVLSVMPSVGGTLASIGVTLYQIFWSKGREEFKDLFHHSMAPHLLEELAESKKLPTLDGELREVTVFISDNQFFSLLSHAFRHEPKMLMNVLHRYLMTVSDSLIQSGACIDKYVHGEVIALFGTPMVQLDHAARACQAALSVIKALEQLRSDMALRGLPSVPIHIVIHTDRMLVGNIGGSQLFDYTALGDGMEFTVHLLSLASVYGVSVILGPNTFEQAKESIEVRELDFVRIPGTSEQVPIYELMGLKGSLSEHDTQIMKCYQSALSLYRQQKFIEVFPLLTLIAKIAPSDQPSRLLFKACQKQMISKKPFSGLVVQEE